MTEPSIPVDLFNPGQVFACVGFLEAADLLLGAAEGGFNWSDEANVRFFLRTTGDYNPFAVVIEFLSRATLLRIAPNGYTDPPSKRSMKSDSSTKEEGEEEDPVACQGSEVSDTFPGREWDRMALPLRLRDGATKAADLTHWADGSSRNEFKLYAGNRSAFDIARAMLRGTRKKPTKKHPQGEVLTRGVDALYRSDPEKLAARPFDVLTRMGGSFNFDPRGAWTALDAGYSPNQHQHHGVNASPVVEILAAWGLEHARPDEFETRRVRYAVWSGPAPPMLARPLLGGATLSIPVRRFRFELDYPAKGNKLVTYAQEETSA